MIILASQSPRRRELLTLAGIEYECIPSGVEEKVPAGLDLTKVPEFLSALKASDVASSHPGDIVIGADTLVEFDGKALGKPRDPADAARMLRELSGRCHKVFTGVTIVSPLGTESFTSVTEVEFYELTDREIEDYIATGEPMDKAGAYGIQGYGSVLVRRIDGDYFTVMGLPLAETVRRIRGIEKNG
ncbi:MAG: septum formation protein Maf [Lachnospiraceae bacterium]|nr:septum formation protein Maf [Lachnospiraceae bacterium]